MKEDNPANSISQSFTLTTPKNLSFFCTLFFLFILSCGNLPSDSKVINDTVSDIGNVEGTVTDASTGALLLRVTVQIGDKSAYTNNDGIYTISEVTVGSRTITAVKTGYQTYTDTVDVSKGTTVTKNMQLTSEDGSDTTAPSNTTGSNFINNGASSTSSISAILSLSASDNVGVTGYYISESSTTPSASATGWTMVISTTSYSSDVSFTLSSGSGTKTVYVWFRDDVGNVSAVANDRITLSSIYSTPSDVSAVAGNKEATISWGSVNDAISYNIYWSTTSGVTKTTGTQITGVTSPYTHTGLTNDTTYYYVVTAINTYGESSESNEVSAIPYFKMLKLPDTGQTTSYTTTFGEDNDYTINLPSYTDNGNGTITDNVTGFMWQKEDDNTTRTWNDAGTYCDNLSLGEYTNWRLPSDMELMSIVNYGTYNPAIDSTYFPNTNSSNYWSSTTYAYSSSSAWNVYFFGGRVPNDDKSNSYYVRCVRGGQ